MFLRNKAVNLKDLQPQKGAECNMTEEFQIFLLVAVIPALILFLIYLIKKEIKEIDSTIVEYLKKAVPEPMQEYEKAGIKKDYVFSFLCGFLTTGLFFAILTALIDKIVFSVFEDRNLLFVDYSHIYFGITSALNACTLGFGILVPLLWMIRDKKHLQTKALLVKQPVYVHSTSSLSTSYGNRTAYLVYWDRKRGRLRAKTVQIKGFEEENGKLFSGEFVLCATEEKKTKIRFLSLLTKKQRDIL